MHSIKVTSSAKITKSDSNERLNDIQKHKVSSFYKSSSCEHLSRKSSSFDNLKKINKVSSTSSLSDILTTYQMKPNTTPDDSQGFQVDELTDSFLNDHVYLHIDNDNKSDDDFSLVSETYHENETKDNHDSKIKANMIKHFAATHGPGIVYDCIQKKDDIIDCPANILHIVQDHVTSQAIHCLSDHIFRM